jgi:hypothetical protein
MHRLKGENILEIIGCTDDEETKKLKVTSEPTQILSAARNYQEL